MEVRCGGGLKVCVGGLVRKRKCFLSLSKERFLSLQEEDVIDPYLLLYQHNGGLHIKISIGFVKAHVALHITYGLPCSISPCIHCHSGQVSIDIPPIPSCHTHGWA